MKKHRSVKVLFNFPSTKIFMRKLNYLFQSDLASRLGPKIPARRNIDVLKVSLFDPKSYWDIDKDGNYSP